MKSTTKKIGNSQLHWFLGILCLLIIIAISIIFKEISVKTGVIMGGIIIISSPFILWFSNTRRKHDDNIHYNEEGSACYKDSDRNCTENP